MIRALETLDKVHLERDPMRDIDDALSVHQVQLVRAARALDSHNALVARVDQLTAELAEAHRVISTLGAVVRTHSDELEQAREMIDRVRALHAKWVVVAEDSPTHAMFNPGRVVYRLGAALAGASEEQAT